MGMVGWVVGDVCVEGEYLSSAVWLTNRALYFI